jgi:hypothetical protein
MQVVGNAANRSENFNGVSDKLKEELIKQVKQGQLIHFQLLNGMYDVTLKRETFGASRSITLRDRIYDPYASEVKDEKGNVVKDKNGDTQYKGAYVEIGVPDSIINGRVEKCKKFWVESIANGIPGNGQFSLSADSISDMETYEILCLMNGNKDNPHRGKSKEAQYEVVYPSKVAQAQKDKDLKELKSKIARLTKENPEAAAELSELLPKEKKKEEVPV